MNKERSQESYPKEDRYKKGGIGLKIHIISNDTTSLNTKENQTTIINFSETVLPLNPNCFQNRVHYNSSRQSGFSEIISVIFFSSLHWLSPQISVIVFSGIFRGFALSFSKEKESAKEKGHSEAVLLNIVAHLEKLDRKFDSRLTEYDTKFRSFSQVLLDTIGDTMKTTVEERLRVLGVSNSSQTEGQHVMVSEDNQQPESNSGQPDGQNVMVSKDNRQPDSNSGQPASKTPIDKQSEDSQPQKTPDKGQSEKNLADDIAKADAKGMGAKLNSKVVRDKAAGVKKNLDSAFGNADATNADLVSDFPGKEPPFGRGCRGLGKRNNFAADLERNEAELKKKQKQEEAELKRKKKQEEAELKKKQKKEEPPCLNYAAVMLDIAQPNLKPYPKIGKYLISQPIRLHKTKVKVDIAQPNLKPYPKIGKYLISQPIRLHKAAVKIDKKRLENSVFAILSSANRENLPVLYPGPCDFLDTTCKTRSRPTRPRSMPHVARSPQLLVSKHNCQLAPRSNLNLDQVIQSEVLLQIRLWVLSTKIKTVQRVVLNFPLDLPQNCLFMAFTPPWVLDWESDQLSVFFSGFFVFQGDHDTLVPRSCDLTGAFPCTAVRPDDPIQDRGHDKSPPFTKDSSSNPVVLTSCLMTKVPSELLCTWNMEHARLVLSNQFVASPTLFLLTDHVLGLAVEECILAKPAHLGTSPFTSMNPKLTSTLTWLTTTKLLVSKHNCQLAPRSNLNLDQVIQSEPTIPTDISNLWEVFNQLRTCIWPLPVHALLQIRLWVLSTMIKTVQSVVLNFPLDLPQNCLFMAFTPPWVLDWESDQLSWTMTRLSLGHVT
ncbi:hypothetical protein IGI04_030169 [Brassica rapa subsp. trilocularis]|uniref:Uncharacterized protein n=1 Tax=Brassica rapa subsp. trilocularis TaxID=1813537 RepID=A0ABQ7LPX6_BRACM|nr:hypothetical protein IGI04_030169 [Brassica rapa subsp. trilocularis]